MLSTIPAPETTAVKNATPLQGLYFIVVTQTQIRNKYICRMMKNSVETNKTR